MNKLRYSIIYAVIRPEIFERVSVGLIFIENNKVEMHYSNEKLKALHGLLPKESYDFISQVVRSMGRRSSEYTIDTIGYLTHYTNNIISISPIQSIDIKPTEQNKIKLYRNYVYRGS
ncbi:MAG: hypothetical protein IJ197_02785 [Bacteroidaceae bacterium]|nr:hypothetical protein [Bacteroidaceae bacterium]